MIDHDFEDLLRALASRYPRFRLRVTPSGDPDDPSIRWTVWLLDVPKEELPTVELDALGMAFDLYGDEAMPAYIGALTPEASRRRFPDETITRRIGAGATTWVQEVLSASPSDSCGATSALPSPSSYIQYSAFPSQDWALAPAGFAVGPLQSTWPGLLELSRAPSSETPLFGSTLRLGNIRPASVEAPKPIPFRAGSPIAA